MHIYWEDGLFYREKAYLPRILSFIDFQCFFYLIVQFGVMLLQSISIGKSQFLLVKQSDIFCDFI